MTIFDNRKVAASVRSEEDFRAALKSDVEVIFMQNSDILNVKEQIIDVHEAGKKIFIHMDFAEGIGKDRAGLNFVKLMGADGILTTKTGMIRAARETGLITVQRFFIVDSHSVDTAVESIKIAKPDIVEIHARVLLGGHPVDRENLIIGNVVLFSDADPVSAHEHAEEQRNPEES